MDKANKLLTMGILTILLMAMIATVAPARAQAETITTDKGLYAIIFSDTNTGYVNVTVTMSNLDPTAVYKVVVSRFNGPESAAIEGTFSLGYGEFRFTLPGSRDARPADLAGTWNATLYKKVGATYQLVTFVNFGVWGINSNITNYGRILQVFGGGFSSDKKVCVVINKTDTGEIITDDLFGENPAKCKVSTLPDATYGRVSNSSKPIPSTVEKGTYDVWLTDYKMLPKVTSNVYENKTSFTITDELMVKIISPADGSQFNRTQTVNVEAEVLYMDYEPVTAGTVTALFDLPGGGASPYNKDKSITLTYDPVSKTWKGSLKIQKDNVTGTWNITVAAQDNYGNNGSDSVEIEVFPAVLVVTTVKDPEDTVPRASWVTWQVKITYEGDGSLADLNIPGCTVYVVNATTNAIVGSAYIIKVATGYYNITWFVPADAPLGAYKFMIPKNGLEDVVDPNKSCKRNIGPKAVVFSAPFTVGITALNVVVDTYAARDVTSQQKAFEPGKTVYIGASVTYKDSGVVMSSGSVRAYIYNATGYLIAEIPMTFYGDTRMWWCSWSSTGYKAGYYTVVVKARDIGGNIGEGSTYFLLAGATISPTKGTVPPDASVKATALDPAKTKYLVTASIFTDPVSGKKLGTTVTITGTTFTPNSKVNITITGLPYLTGKTVFLAVNVPTDASGAFTYSFVFPTAPKGTYTMTITDAKGVTQTVTFTVVPGLILTPGEVVGSAMIKVIGTGYEASVPGTAMLLNGTDALYPIISMQITNWKTNANGTIATVTYSEWPTGVTPAFTMPYIEPGVYSITLYMGKASATDTVKVVNAFKQLPAMITNLDDLMTLLKYVNVTLVGVSGNVAILVTDVGVVKADTATIKTMLTGMNATLVDVKDGVVTISTTVGEIKTTVDALNATIVSVSEDVVAIKTDVGTIKADTATIKTMLTRMNATLVSVSGSVATISTTVGTIKASLDALSPKIDSISGSVATISTTVGTIKSSVDALSPKVTSIEGDMATVKTTMGTLTGKVESIDGNVATVKTDVGTIRAELATVKSDVSDVKDTVSEVPSAVSNVSLAVWVAVVLSLIAAIGSIVSLIMLRKKIA
ncbi:MAG: hypothetical protein QW186_08635 [Candidatus Bathyarchaeia archaeon]